ncbi:MAG TPA: acyl-CoA dehydrogenase [Burkholderiaceae bacterium]|nr:acyl-CoA dehydrogenase [Burkholderiaceae bacterium]
MDFQYTEEQQLLADSLERLVEKTYDFESRQKIVRSDAGYSAELWSNLAELGLLSLPFAEQHGGFGGGTTDLIATMQAVGKGLLAEPVLSTLLGGRLIANAGSEAQHAELLPSVIDGSTRLAFAYVETDARYEPAQIAAKATKSGDGWTLDGEKIAVQHGPLADKLIVAARSAGAAGDREGLSLFVVDPKAQGVSLNSYRSVDNQRVADITFQGVKLPADALLGEAGKAWEAIDEALDFATVLLCCEAVGAMNFANETTLEYLKTRKQFGVTIGSFQALQHRMVDMTISAAQSYSICLLATARLDAAARGELDAAERRRVVSGAKIKVAEASRHVGQEAIQLHGGMGMTEELKVSHTFKRLTMIGQLFGDVDHHLERFAATA